MKTLILFLIGLGLALLFKGAGRLYATLYRTDATSAKRTVAEHFALAARLFRGALVFGLLVIAAFLVPPAWAVWALTAGLGLLVVLNVSLGGLAGTSSSLGRLLARPRRWDDIGYQVQMKERARDILGRYVLIMIAVALVSASPAQPLAAEACGIAVDETASLDEIGRADAIAFIKNTAFDYINATGCSWVVVARFGAETRFSRRTWIKSVKEPEWMDCSAIRAEPLTGHEAIFSYAHNVTVARNREAVDACRKAMDAARRSFEESRARFGQALGVALTVTPKVEFSRITEFVKEIARSGLYRSLIVISDGLDNPSVPLDDLRLPDGLRVVMIIVPPATKYATPEQALARARQWAAVPNVTLVTTAELFPGLWESVHQGRTP